MAQFLAFDKTAEVNGETVLSIVNGMDSFKDGAKKILTANGIIDPKPGQWYRQQSWLDAFKEISAKLGGNTLILIGAKIPENAQWPPNVKTIEEALPSVDIAYHINHRIGQELLFDPKTGTMKEGIGHYTARKSAEKSMDMICNNPYPCDFDFGIIKSVANKFKPAGAIIIVTHDDSKPCRKKGGESCTYKVSW